MILTPTDNETATLRPEAETVHYIQRGGGA